MYCFMATSRSRFPSPRHASHLYFPTTSQKAGFAFKHGPSVACSMIQETDTDRMIAHGQP